MEPPSSASDPSKSERVAPLGVPVSAQRGGLVPWGRPGLCLSIQPEAVHEIADRCPGRHVWRWLGRASSRGRPQEALVPRQDLGFVKGGARVQRLDLERRGGLEDDETFRTPEALEAFDIPTQVEWPLGPVADRENRVWSPRQGPRTATSCDASRRRRDGSTCRRGSAPGPPPRLDDLSPDAAAAVPQPMTKQSPDPGCHPCTSSRGRGRTSRRRPRWCEGGAAPPGLRSTGSNKSTTVRSCRRGRCTRVARPPTRPPRTQPLPLLSRRDRTFHPSARNRACRARGRRSRAPGRTRSGRTRERGRRGAREGSEVPSGRAKPPGGAEHDRTLPADRGLRAGSVPVDVVTDISCGSSVRSRSSRVDGAARETGPVTPLPRQGV